MHVLKLPFYLGLFAALLGVLIALIEFPKLYEKFSTLLERHVGGDRRVAVTVLTLSKDPHRLSLERNVFEFLNYRVLSGARSEKWDILWSVEYPFRHVKKSLQSHQRINHFPGMSHLTIKKHLATKFSYDFIPKAFTFPSMRSDFLEYIEKNPNKKFVEKNWNNRGVKLVRNTNAVSFDAKEKFLQEFVENPLLVDGRMFDIGIYVLVSSFDPLRAYKFDKEILLRFCSEEYHPLNEENTKQYVVDDESKYVWDIKSLQDYAMNFTSKSALELYMRHSGHCDDMANVWEQMDDAITTLLLDNENEVISDALRSNLGHPAVNFFEILRFDFILDESLRVHLMEVNMSPNLMTVKDFAHIKRNYRSQLVHDTLNLVGAEELLRTDSRNDYILSDERDVAIPLSTNEHECGLEMGERPFVRRAFREHVKRGGRMRRIFPLAKHFNNRNLIARVSDVNRVSIKYFHCMCRINKDWC